MNNRRLLIAVLILLMGAGAVAWLLLDTTPPPNPEEPETALLEIGQWGRAGEYGYATYAAQGEAPVVVLGLNRTPQTKAYILVDPNGIGMTNVDAFVDSFTMLYAYGYEVEVVGRVADIQEGVYIVPTGAMPTYALRSLEHPNVTMVYLGKKDLLIENGIKEVRWYDDLTPEQQNRMVIQDTTLDELFEANRSALPRQVLEQTWDVVARVERTLPEGNGTLMVRLGRAEYMRILYLHPQPLLANATRQDSPALHPTTQINVSPEDIYPWERSVIGFGLNESSGGAMFRAERNGVVAYTENLGRIFEPQLFFIRPRLTEPGDYVLRVIDGEGEIASGRLHIYALNVRFGEAQGNRYIFHVTVDDKPMENGRASVRLNHSDGGREYFIQNGELMVPARLQQGRNIFVIQILEHTDYIAIENQRENVLDVYIRYGTPGVVLVAIVFALAHMARRPVYRLRFGNIGREIRKDVHIQKEDAMRMFERVSEGFHVEGPITAKEFSLALKRHVTEGAEVTDGNVEAVLKGLMDSGKVESYHGYYQPTGRGSLRRNVLRRMAREMLIENGIEFVLRNGILVTRDFEIGFLGDRFEKKAYVIVEDYQERAAIYETLSPAKKAAVQLQEQTKHVEFITPEQLKQIL